MLDNIIEKYLVREAEYNEKKAVDILKKLVGKDFDNLSYNASSDGAAVDVRDRITQKLIKQLPISHWGVSKADAPKVFHALWLSGIGDFTSY